jgi:ATP-dependent DNA helicase RecG
VGDREEAARYTPAEFAVIIARETDDVELKTGTGARPLQEAMVAFSNSEGGSIYIGVTDDREVVGRLRDQGTDDAIHEAALNTRGLGRYAISQIDVGGTPVVVIDVDPRPDEVAQTSDGRVLKRQGGRNVAVFGGDLWQLMSSRALRRYEHADSHVSVDKVLPGMAEELASVHGWPDGYDTQARWTERNLLHSSGHLTVAGALLMTDPATTLGASKFNIDLRSYESDSSTSYVRRENINGPVQIQVEQAAEWILRDIGTEIVITGTRRHDVPRLPRRVVREVVANAVAHRDYSQDRTPIVVEIRPSHVKITSPGRLPAPVSLATLREAQAPRNHTVIGVLRRFGLAEDSGQGIDVIQDEMRFELLAEPQFSEMGDSFVVLLPLQGQVSAHERGWLAELERQGKLRQGERLLLLTVLREGRITNARARDALQIDSVQARSTLRRLRDSGLLNQHGAKRRAYYTLGTIGPDRSNERVVLDAARSEDLTNTRVRELTGLDRVGSRNLLRRLVEEDDLIQIGERRGTRYVLSRK